MNECQVLLIGGAPGAGKTTLARAVAARLGWPTTTCDDFRHALRGVTTPNSHPALHNPQGHVPYFTDSSVDTLIADAIALQDAMWPAIENVVRMHATVKEPIVMDWWLLSPEKVIALGMANVKSVWIKIAPDALAIRERRTVEFRQNSPDPQQMFENFMARSLWRNTVVASKAQELGLPVIEQPGDRSVSSLVDEVVEILPAL